MQYLRLAQVVPLQIYKPYDMRSVRTNNHHIIPRSKGGKDDKNNLSKINVTDHEKYHYLFENRTPEEILFLLINYYWKSQDGFNGEKHLRNFLHKTPYRI